MTAVWFLVQVYEPLLCCLLESTVGHGKYQAHGGTAV